MFDYYLASTSLLASVFFLVNMAYPAENSSAFCILSLLLFVTLFWAGFVVFYAKSDEHKNRQFFFDVFWGLLINFFFFFGIQKIIYIYNSVDNIKKLNNIILLSYGSFLLFLCSRKIVKNFKQNTETKTEKPTAFKIFVISTIVLMYLIWATAYTFYLFRYLEDAPVTFYSHLNYFVFNESKFAIDTLFSIYVSVLVGCFTLYFTVFSFIKPKKMSLTNYTKYLIEPYEKVLFISLFAVFIVNTILIFFHIDNTFYRIALVDSIFMIFLYTAIGIYKLSYLENEKTAAKIYVSKVCSELQKNTSQTSNEKNINEQLFEDYLYPCFEYQSYTLAFQYYEKDLDNFCKNLSPEEKSEIIIGFSKNSIAILNNFLKSKIKTIMIDEQKANHIVYVMNRIIDSNLSFILKNYKSDQDDYFDEVLSICNSFYEIWFNLYIELIQCGYKNIKYSMLLRGVEPLSFGISFLENANKNISEKYIILYNLFLHKSYEICCIILYQYDFWTFRNFLQDYINLSQFINLNYHNSNIMDTYYYYLITIGNHISNLYEEKRIDDRYLEFLPYIYKDVGRIYINLINTDLYYELLSLPEVQYNTKDFKYYFLLSIIYLLSYTEENKKSQLISGIFSEKIKYPENQNVFESLFDLLDKFTCRVDLNQEDIKSIKSILEDKIKRKKIAEAKELKAKINESLNDEIFVNKIIANDFSQYEQHFSYCSIYEDKNYKEIVLPKGFKFVHSEQYIAHLSSHDIYGIYSCLDIIDMFIYNEFITYSKVINVSSIDEIIKDAAPDNEITLIYSRKFHMYFRTLEDIVYEGMNTIIYKNVKIHLSLNRQISDYIIIEKDLKNSIFMKKLSVEKHHLAPDKDDPKNTSVSVPFEPEFYINTAADSKVYSIIGIQNDEINGEV